MRTGVVRQYCSDLPTSSLTPLSSIAMISLLVWYQYTYHGRTITWPRRTCVQRQRMVLPSDVKVQITRSDNDQEEPGPASLRFPSGSTGVNRESGLQP